MAVPVQIPRSFVPGGLGTRIFFAAWKLAGRILSRPRGAGNCAPSRIVVTRFGYIGDGVLTTAVLSPLKEAWPDSAIDVITFSSARPVFQTHPSVRSIFSSPMLEAETLRELLKAASLEEIRRTRDFLRRADLLLLLNHIVSPGGCLKYWLLPMLCREARVVGLDTDGRGTFLDVKVPDEGLLCTHEVALFRDLLSAIGIERSLGELRVHVGQGKEDGRRAEALIDRLSGRPFVVFHAGSAAKGWRAAKRLDPEMWKALGLRMGREYGFAVVLVGTAGEAEENREIRSRMADPFVLDLTGQTTVPELVALIGKASLFVGTDSGVAHLAAVTSTPGITLFTFSDWIGYAPWSERMRVITTHAECGPCLYWQGYRECRDRSCFEIPVEIVMEQARILLSEVGR